MNNQLVLRMQHIRKVFSGVTALDDVELSLHKGEVHILLGENGAGKSTLMKILSGAYQKTEGRIFLDGKEIAIKNPGHAQQMGISIIYQEFNLVPYLSAAENIFLGREPFIMPGVIDRKKLYGAAQKLLHELGLSIDAHELVKDLGMAQQQMIEVAKALSLDAKILIMDEPTSALTEHEINELFSTIRRLTQKGVSVVYISHRMEELFEIGDRVTVLRDGKYVGTHKISAITRKELVRMMVDRDLQEHFPKQTSAIGNEVLRVEKLCRGNVLQEVSFSLHAGEVLGIAGLMGSGRTELARAIFGVDQLDSGKIYVRGQLQNIKSPRTAINLGIGFLTEDRKSQGLILILPVKENICLPSVERFSRMGIVQAKLETQAALQYYRDLRIKGVGLNQKVMYLSGGNQQKVVLGKWLCREAGIFIFDEPTRGIDVGSKVEIYQLMNRLTSEGVALMMISSDLPEILGMSDRILVMCRGKVSAELSAAEATQEKILHHALGGVSGS